MQQWVQLKSKITQYHIAIFIILILAAILRFANFNTHWGIGNDDARDALIAREAIHRHELPVIGSFSSAGPFVFGPLFYWVIIFSYLVLPTVYTAPWIITGIAGVLTVLVLILATKNIAGEKFAIITGVLATTSPQLISRSLSLGQHTYVALTSSLLILFFIKLWQQKKIIYAFLMGFSLGVAFNMHYQTINLLIFFPILLFIPNISFPKKIIAGIFMTIGFIIPSLPLLLWDAKQDFANIRNILDYLLVAQYRLYIPNSWKIFLINFLPYYWSFVVGSFKPLGLILMGVTPLTILYLFFKQKLPSIIIALSSILAIFLIVNRYYHGERSEGYLIYMLPFILLVTSYTLYMLIFQTKIKLFGVALALIILAGNLYHFHQHLQFISPVQALEREIDQLVQKYPGKKFTVYDYKWQNSFTSQPLSFLLEKRQLIDPAGIPIGFSCAGQNDCVVGEPLPEIIQMNDKMLYDLTTAPLLNDASIWFNVNPSNLYDDLMRWSKTEKLHSTFKFF